MAFVLDWQKKLGYRTDPFAAAPAKRVSAYFVDREGEREKLNLFLIKQERFGILAGTEGSGKTTLLRWLEEQLGGKLHIIFLDGGSAQKAFLASLVDGTLSVLERKVTKPQEKLQGEALLAFLLERLAKRRLLLIVDEAQRLSNESKSILQAIVQRCPAVQTIIAVERPLKEHEAYGEDRLGLQIEEMEEGSLVELLGRRIALAGGVGTYPFDAEEMRRLVAAAKRSPVKLLALARERAIELSLKAGRPPQRKRKESKRKEAKREEVPPQAEETLPEEAPEEEMPLPERTKHGLVKQPPKKWFSIRFVKEEQLEAEQEAQQEAEIRKAKSFRPTGETLLDAQLLGTIVEKAKRPGAQQRPERGKAADKQDVNEVIQSLVDELEPQKKRR